MPGGWPVTGLAADADFGPTGRVTRVGRVEVLAYVSAVALDAAAVRVLNMARPEEGVLGIDIFVGLQMVPALPALHCRPAVPGYIQRLQVTLASIDQILLQRVVPEGIFDGVDSGLTILTHGCYLVSTIVFEQARVDAVKADADIVEITQHGGFVGGLHRLAMIRLLPIGVYSLVALDALRGTDECSRLFSCGGKCDDQQTQQV